MNLDRDAINWCLFAALGGLFVWALLHGVL
jgi:hypothetical protein